MKNFIQKVTNFFKFDIWDKSDHEYKSNALRVTVRQLRVFIFTARSYGKNDLIIRSAALTYYTLAALVPLAAIVFGIAKGFTFESSIQNYMLDKFPDHTVFIEHILNFAEAMLQRTKGGIIAVTGTFILLWAVIKVFINIENSFNLIWEVHRERSITRKMSDYISVLMVAPIFWFVSNNASETIGAHIDRIAGGTFFEDVVNFIGLFVPFIVICIMLTVVYFIMPNTKVKFKAAFSAAIVAGIALHGFQIGYFYSQATLSKYNTIYGAFAALPLLLIWMNISWQIIMFGAELSFGYQNIERYEMERQSHGISHDYRRKITILVLHQIAMNFAKGDEPMDSDQMAKKLNMPVRVIRDVLFDLEHAELVASIYDDNKRTTFYLPFRDLSRMKVYDVIKLVDGAGLKNFNIEEYDDLRAVNKVVDSIEKEIDGSDKNILLIDINTSEKRTKA